MQSPPPPARVSVRFSAQAVDATDRLPGAFWAALEILDAASIKVRAKHVGGIGARVISFDVWSGDVWMHRRESGVGI